MNKLMLALLMCLPCTAMADDTLEIRTGSAVTIHSGVMNDVKFHEELGRIDFHSRSNDTQVGDSSGIGVGIFQITIDGISHEGCALITYNSEPPNPKSAVVRCPVVGKEL